MKNKLILEFTEFNAMRLNPDSANMSISVDNPQLSINSFDRHEDSIRNGVSRINNIIHSLSNSSSFRSLKSKFVLEEQKIQSLKILRIVKIDNVNYNVYISFVVSDDEYFGVIEDILSRNATFKSEIFKNFDLVQSTEWIIRTKGILIKTIKEWLQIENGSYTLLNDEIICYSIETGRMAKITKNSNIEVVRSSDNKIVIKYNNEYYNLINDNFIYFNFWFKKIS